MRDVEWICFRGFEGRCRCINQFQRDERYIPGVGNIEHVPRKLFRPQSCVFQLFPASKFGVSVVSTSRETLSGK